MKYYFIDEIMPKVFFNESYSTLTVLDVSLIERKKKQAFCHVLIVKCTLRLNAGHSTL